MSSSPRHPASQALADQAIRHPTDFPIDYRLDEQQPKYRRRLKQVGHDGLCFQSDHGCSPGRIVHITIPTHPWPFEAQGIVAWCRRDGDQYEVEVRFADEATRFAVRMVEQICYIEHYRREVLAHEGRALNTEEAAAEWIARYAARFPEKGDPADL